VETLSINIGVSPRTAEGVPPETFIITPVSSAALPPIQPGLMTSGYACDIEPSAATFDPAVTLSFIIPMDTWQVIKGNNPAIYWYNPQSGAWEQLPTTVDEQTGTLSTQITHTSTYAVLTTQAAPISSPTPTVTATPVSTGGFPGWIMYVVIIIVAVVVVVAVIFILVLRRKTPPPPPPEPVPDWDEFTPPVQ
jgi:hypothetical protein